MNRFYLSVAVLGMLAFVSAGQVLADRAEEVEPGIHPELAEHTKHFAFQIYRVADNVYSAVGWNVANIVMVEGDDGIILVDAGLSPVTSAAVLQKFREITPKPIKAVIYSHFHHDHIDGIKGLVSAEEVAEGKVAIYAHETLLQNLVDESDILGPILGVRAGYTFGFFLQGADLDQMNAGIGPLATAGRPGTFIAPTHTVGDYLKIEIAGVQLEILHVPSEAPDELAVYLPESRVLIDTEVLQGPTFPNLHTLRGTKFRDPVQWVKSIDKLRKLKAAYLVPTHGQPVHGEEKVEEVLRMTRDGIQYVHDQTVRHMNKGLTPDELANTVKLPEHLAGYAPYLRQYYGTVKQAVRQIYVGYLGWFEGDPVDLDPIPKAEQARRLVALAGGREAMLKAAGDAYGSGDFQWAAELATHLIRVDHNDEKARRLKANAFRQLGYANMNINWRNWYLTSAKELEGKLEAALDAKKMAGIFMPPDIVTAWPAGVSISSWSSRLRAEATLATRMSLGFNFADLKEQYSLTVRRGVCQFDEGLLEENNLVLTLTKPVYDQIVLGTLSFEDALQEEGVSLAGERAELKQFLGFFEPAGSSAIDLTVR